MQTDFITDFINESRNDLAPHEIVVKKTHFKVLIRFYDEIQEHKHAGFITGQN